MTMFLEQLPNCAEIRRTLEEHAGTGSKIDGIQVQVEQIPVIDLSNFCQPMDSVPRRPLQKRAKLEPEAVPIDLVFHEMINGEMVEITRERYEELVAQGRAAAIPEGY